MSDKIPIIGCDSDHLTCDCGGFDAKQWIDKRLTQMLIERLDQIDRAEEDAILNGEGETGNILNVR